MIVVIETNVCDQLRHVHLGEGREEIINTKEGKGHKLFEHEYNQTTYEKAILPQKVPVM